MSVQRPALANTVLDLIGATPMVRLHRVTPAGAAEIVVKLESLNPGGSVKDRIARAMVEDAECSGALSAGDTIVEPTSGNTGVGLALVAAVKGYRLILTMPEDMSHERRRLLERFGAEVILTPAIEGMTGAVFAAEELASEPGYFMPQQFLNPSNPEVHRRTTARESLGRARWRARCLCDRRGNGRYDHRRRRVAARAQARPGDRGRRTAALSGAAGRPLCGARDPGHRRVRSCPACSIARFTTR